MLEMVSEAEESVTLDTEHEEGEIIDDDDDGEAPYTLHPAPCTLHPTKRSQICKGNSIVQRR